MTWGGCGRGLMVGNRRLPFQFALEHQSARAKDRSRGYRNEPLFFCVPDCGVPVLVLGLCNRGSQAWLDTDTWPAGALLPLCFHVRSMYV